MQVSSPRDPEAVDSEGQVFFNLPEQGQNLSENEPNRQEDDRLSEASFLTVERASAAVNTSLELNSIGNNAIEQVSSMIQDLSGTLKDVVAQLKILSNRQSVINNSSENTSYRSNGPTPSTLNRESLLLPNERILDPRSKQQNNFMLTITNIFSLITVQVMQQITILTPKTDRLN